MNNYQIDIKFKVSSARGTNAVFDYIKWLLNNSGLQSVGFSLCVTDMDEVEEFVDVAKIPTIS